QGLPAGPGSGRSRGSPAQARRHGPGAGVGRHGRAARCGGAGALRGDRAARADARAHRQAPQRLHHPDLRLLRVAGRRSGPAGGDPHRLRPGAVAMTGQLPYQSLPTREPGGSFQLLDGVRVLDLTTSLAGPYATMLLADLGAEVVKVERPGVGDDSRAWGPPFLDGAALWFLAANRNKRSITLDYSRDPGRGILHRLIAESDVLISTFRGST